MNRREALQAIIGTGAVGLLVPSDAGAEPADATSTTKPQQPPLTKEGLRFWLESSLKRVYPTSPPGGAAPLPLVTARNARLSFQACFRNDRINSVVVKCEVV